MIEIRLSVSAETAALLRQANFTEVEVGLQSIEPEAMTLMERKNNLRAFERGVRAMLREGIKVKVDLIVGLPGDNVASVRRGLRYLRDEGLYSDVQVFHLSILPGTAFRHEASSLGLSFQTRPPYYVLRTPTLNAADIFDLLAEAQEIFELEFDAPPAPMLALEARGRLHRAWHVDLDAPAEAVPPARRAQAFTLWLRSNNFAARRAEAALLIRRLLADNPFTTLLVVLDPKESTATSVRASINPETAAALLEACQEQPTYLDKYYALHPGRATGAKRLVVLLPFALRERLSADWLEPLSDIAAIVWRDGDISELEANEFAWAECVPGGLAASHVE